MGGEGVEGKGGYSGVLVSRVQFEQLKCSWII